MDESTMRAALERAARTLRDMAPGGMGEQTPFTIAACDPERREAVYAFDAPPDWMHNPMGWLHGGMIATLMDSAMGIHCVLYSNGVPTPTVSLQVSYLQPCPMNQPLSIRTHIIKPGRNMIFAEATLWVKEESRPSATATAVYYVAVADQ